MDHMCISGTEPSYVILSQTEWFNKKLKSDAQKYLKSLLHLKYIQSKQTLWI